MKHSDSDFPHMHRMRLRVNQGGDGIRVLNGFVLGGDPTGIDFPERLVLVPYPEHRWVPLDSVIDIVEDLGPVLVPPPGSKVRVINFDDHHGTPVRRNPAWMRLLTKSGLRSTAEHVKERTAAQTLSDSPTPARDGDNGNANASGIGDLRRWQEELNDPRIARGTLAVGAVGKAQRLLDQAAARKIQGILSREGEPAYRICEKVTEGRPLERLSLGQRLNVLEALDSRYLVVRGRRIIGRDLRSVIRRATKLRNHELHYDGEPYGTPEDLKQFIDDCLVLMTSDLFLDEHG